MAGQPTIIPLAEPYLPDDCAEAVKRQVASTFVGPGATSELFGRRIAETCGVPFAIPMASGTVALSVSAQILGLKAGDEIIVPAYGVVSVINAFASIGLSPRLAEIDRRTGCLDPLRLDEAITPRTKAVVYIDFCGSIGDDLDDISDQCRARSIPLIEDAAWALGRGEVPRRGGSFGAIGATSFSVPKIITTGQGGALLAHDEQQRDAAVRAIDQGDVAWRRTNINNGVGSNLRLSDVSAALGLAQLERLNDRLSRKRAAFEALASKLGDKLFRAVDGGVPTQNIVFSSRPDELVAALRESGILAVRQYRAMYHHPPFRSLQDRRFEASEFWEQQAVYLPFGLALKEEDAVRIGERVANFADHLIDPLIA
jgi:perosamine synthetase